MPSRESVEAFAAQVVAGQYVAAIEGWYTADATMQENGADPRGGRDALVEGERRTMARFASIGCERLGPILIDGDHVAIRWRFTFRPASGAESMLDEIAWQRWEGELIAEERFFYDPSQLGR
jgi:hypothetical protein